METAAACQGNAAALAARAIELIDGLRGLIETVRLSAAAAPDLDMALVLASRSVRELRVPLAAFGMTDEALREERRQGYLEGCEATREAAARAAAAEFAGAYLPLQLVRQTGPLRAASGD